MGCEGGMLEGRLSKTPRAEAPWEGGCGVVAVVAPPLDADEAPTKVTSLLGGRECVCSVGLCFVEKEVWREELRLAGSPPSRC